MHVVILEIIFVDILRIWQIVGHITDEEEVYGEDEMEEADMDDTTAYSIQVADALYTLQVDKEGA